VFPAIFKKIMDNEVVLEQLVFDDGKSVRIPWNMM
jgi:hypothetical protein